ncbi:MAG: riboflavin synthase [Eubacterium sp.]|nr:riboflavin synthase [Eubacterium sp.]
MFTGIVEEQGKIREIRHGEKSSVITVEAHRVLEDARIGDSICTNGVCLTVTEKGDDFYRADVMAETMRRSNLGQLKVSDRVNLERAMAMGDRFGGHIVSGHIDGTGVIDGLVKEDNAVWVTVKAPAEILRFIVEKGSVAIDGISLTVAYVDDSCFKVSVIPHTGEETGLLSKKVGDTVNLENDVIGKYVERLMSFSGEKETSSGVTMEMLSENGFL